MVLDVVLPKPCLGIEMWHETSNVPHIIKQVLLQKITAGIVAVVHTFGKGIWWINPLENKRKSQDHLNSSHVQITFS